MTRFRWTIKRKLLALGGGTLLPLLLLLAFWVRWEVREHTDGAEADLTLASQQAAARVVALLEDATGHLDGLVRNPAVQRRQVAVMEELFRELTARHRDIESVSAFAADGRMVAASVRSVEAPVIVADRPWFRQVMATGQPTVSGFLVGRISGQPVAVVVVPLREEGAPITGALAAAVNLRRLHNLFQFLPLAGGRTVTVVDGEGQVLSHAPRGEEWIGRRLPSAAALPAGPAVVTTLAWPEGGERIAAVAPVADTGWRVLVAIPRASLEARTWQEALSIALPLFAILAVSTLIGLLIARRVWRPLEALTDAAARLPRGEALQVRVDSSDEVAELARAFNATTAQITEIRSSLEQRVAELTALSEAGSLLTGTLEITKVLQRLTDLAHVRLAAGVVRIWLREGPSGNFRLAAETGATRVPDEYRIHLAPGEGLVGWIMEHREPLALTDVQADPRLKNREWVKAEGLHTFLGVPIVLGDEPVGVLACLSRERREFSPDEVKLARLFALPAAVAILNARLYEEARARARELGERSRQLQLLHEAARALVSEHDLDRLLQRMVATGRELLGAGYGALAVFQDDGRIRQFFTAGITPEARERIGPLPEGHGLLGYVFTHGQTLRLDDLATHRAAVGFPPGHPPMRTLLAAPIRLREEVLGALYLTEKPGGFTADDEALLTTLTVDAAVAIENARLVASLRQALDDLKTTQDQLVQGEALRAVGGLASGMAHHLNNILAVIRGRVLLLLPKVQDPSIRRVLEIVERKTVDAAEVVQRVQAFSRARPLAEKAPVDLNRIAEDALELTRPHWQDEARRRGVAIEAQLQPGLIPAGAGDPASLKEVLVSLLLNAADALPGNGQITVRTWASDPWVHCAVTDTGVGMSDEVRQQALEPFFTTKGPQSRGLGLSVAHGIIQRHGGTLRIESAPGRGTTVTISLPVAPASLEAPPAPVASTGLASPRRILVIDDEAEVRETLAEILASQGHLVSQASSGADGLSLFRAERHDLVFTDLGMAGMTGYQVAEAIKAVSPATPVVLVTGWVDEIAGGELDAGCVDQVISKPFDLDAVAAAVAKTRARKAQ